MDDDDETEGKSAKLLDEVHKRAIRRFDATVVPQIPMREESLAARRFVEIPGAQWEGSWGEQFENSIRVEIPKIGRAIRKIETDYRENRIVPDFKPDGGESDQDTAATIAGLHRADSYKFKAQQARDNAFQEAIRGGFGAYRLTNVREDEYDRDNDKQRINPGMLITDADQHVFFDLQAKSYGKEDARFAFVLVPYTPDAFKEEWGEDKPIDWPENLTKPVYDWYRPEVVMTCEYYEVEDRTETLYVLTHPLIAEQDRLWKSEIDDEALADKKLAGWNVAIQRRKRRRVHKYILSGAEVLEDCGVIAGCRIPIVPVYGQRTFIDGIERFKGHAHDSMDRQRIYNAMVSRLAETNARSPQEVPIFAEEQMPPNLANLWARAHIDRHPYLLVNPLTDPMTGQILSSGPIGYVKPPELAPVTAALLQIANNDLLEEDQDGADEVKANTSAEAMDIAAARVDAKSGIYLDNMRQSVECEGEIYVGMLSDVYVEEGREVETMSEDGDDGSETLMQPYTDARGVPGVRNDFSKGKYKVIVTVTEATATRRDKTVRSALNMAQVALSAQDMEFAQACLITAAMNSDGEGIEDLQSYARKRGLQIGLVEPNEEEAAQLQEQAQQPDPATILADAQADALAAQAEKDRADAAKKAAEIPLTKAKTIETLTDAGVKSMPANDFEGRPLNKAPGAPF